MLTLVILSAGRGSRFGGNKPLTSVGPNEECLFYYAVYDAILAGFTHCVFVVNEHTKQSFILQQLEELDQQISISFAVQSIDVETKHYRPTQQQRVKPWGTAHAVLSAQHIIHSSFAVINADDFYGRQTFKIIFDDLNKNDSIENYAVMPGFPLGNTISTSGSVNRGLCTVSETGFLDSIIEVHGIYRDKQNIWHSHDSHPDPALHAKSIVSMTFWGFQTSFFELLEEQWREFLQTEENDMNAEFYIPGVVNNAVNSRQLSLRVVPTPETWMGLTYKQDVVSVKDKLKALHDAGLYAHHDSI